MPSPVDLWAYKGQLNGKTDPNDAYAYLRGTNSAVRALAAQVAAQGAAITALAEAKAGDSTAVADAITTLAKSLDAIAAAHANDGDAPVPAAG